MTLQARVSELINSPGRRLLATNLAILAGGEALSRVITAVAFIHLARVFEPVVYGYVELTLAVMMFLTLVVDLGLGTIGAREVARQPASAARLLQRIVSTQMVLAGLTFSLFVAVLLPLRINNTLTLLLLGYGASLLIYPLIFFWVFQGQDRMVWVAVPQVVRQITFAAFVLLVVRNPQQVLLLPAAELAAVVLAALISVVVLRRAGEKLAIKIRGGWDRRLLVESLPIGGSQLIWALRMYLPTILVGTLIGEAAVGFFGAAHRIVMVLQTLLEAYFRNLFPTMSQAAYTSAERLAKLLRNSMWLLMIPALVAALVTSLVAPTLIRVIFGETYRQSEAVQVLAVLIWMIPVLAWRRHGRNALISMSRQREEGICSIVGVILLLASVVPLTNAYGGRGTAWAMVVSELAAAALAWWRVMRYLPNLKAMQQREKTQPDLKPAETKSATANVRLVDVERADPIFIVGAPRSGTSLLRVLLNRHPSIGICDETYFFYYVHARRRAFGDLNDRATRRHLIDRYLATHRINRLDVDRDALAQTLMHEGDSYESFFIALMRFYAASQGKTRYGEKTPQHALFADTLGKWYPNGKLIHLVRDPRDVVASLLRMPWASKSVLANARIWLNHTRAVDRCRQHNNYLLVRYEQLVSEPTAELQRICSFLDEPYTSVMLDADDSVRGDEWWFQRARGPVTTERLGKWRQQLTTKQVALVEWIVRPQMHTYGYEPSSQVASIAAQVFALGEEFADSVQQKVRDLPRMWYFWLRPTHLVKEEAWIDGRV